jgi:HPt (histidine-containing phosphotransfer) domain-containing protein
LTLPRQMVVAFAEMLAARITAMEDALLRADWPEIRRIVHQLTGTGASFGFPELTGEGRALEGALARGIGSADAVSSYVTTCRGALATLRAALEPDAH